MFVSFLRMTHVHVKETFCCRLLLHPDVAVGCSECAVMYTACSESVFFFFSFCYPECDPGCYFLRLSYKVPVRFPRTLFPRPPHRECITHCSSVPLKKKKKKQHKKYKILKISKNNYFKTTFLKRANFFFFFNDKVSNYPDDF